jgi:pimeloyl-ACP methyl ester carboxylesterase
LVVAGELDVTCPREDAEWFAEAVGGQLEILPGVGHLPAYEAPQSIAWLISAVAHVPASKSRLKGASLP